MKIINIIIPIISFGFFFAHPVPEIKAGQVEPKTLVIKKENVTCDGKKDTVSLIGIPYDETASYLKEIFLKVQYSEGGEKTVLVGSGYEPTVQFADINHDGCKDVFVSIQTGGSGGIVQNDLYAYKDREFVDLTVPPPVQVEAYFIDGYKAIIKLSNKKEYNIDLSNRKEDYDRLGLYNDGKLSELSELMVDPYSNMKITGTLSGLGLKGIQRISGAYHADGIGDIESLWFYTNGKWVLEKVKFRELKRHK
ncbi:hypothetical protein [Peribacillus acanthi]|uniref:hypothetical protein n=1 Tax=Peribacillus acanthi TaxID=2171554 RepID=UPI000D3E8852|nr:hypothetical protein [Peribacillus acanthi]